MLEKLIFRSIISPQNPQKWPNLGTRTPFLNVLYDDKNGTNHCVVCAIAKQDWTSKQIHLPKKWATISLPKNMKEPWLLPKHGFSSTRILSLSAGSASRRTQKDLGGTWDPGGAGIDKWSGSLPAILPKFTVYSPWKLVFELEFQVKFYFLGIIEWWPIFMADWATPCWCATNRDWWYRWRILKGIVKKWNLNKIVSFNKFSGMPPAETERRRRTTFVGVFFFSQVPRAKT